MVSAIALCHETVNMGDYYVDTSQTTNETNGVVRKGSENCSSKNADDFILLEKEKEPYRATSLQTMNTSLSQTVDYVESELLEKVSFRLEENEESTERSLRDVARFFEILAEDPPSIKTISEDGCDSDDGHDSTEVHVDDDGSPLSPQKQGTLSAHTRRILSWLFRVCRHSTSHACLPRESKPVNCKGYKGIDANPLEVTRSGMSRGNYSQLHRKAWLEVVDRHHRYGKNLRLYYRHWEALGCPTHDFFDWLDAVGEANGQPVPELEACPRSELDSDTVLYIADVEMTKRYALSIRCDGSGKGYVYDIVGQRVVTGSEGWIFVMRDDVLYGAPKITSIKGQSKQRFHHSSFFGGKAVAAAGILVTDMEGRLTQVLPHSGHYRPGEAETQQMLFFLENKGVDLKSIEVDMQQLIHVNRDDTCEHGKKKKTSTLFLISGSTAVSFLSHKARCIDNGLFSQISKISDDTGGAILVSKALQLVDNGGFWKTHAAGVGKENRC